MFQAPTIYRKLCNFQTRCIRFNTTTHHIQNPYHIMHSSSALHRSIQQSTKEQQRKELEVRR